MDVETELSLWLEALEPDNVTSDGSSEPAIKKKQRLNGQKTCRVCGDRAVAHNFDVLSCESCKAFFRRNALKPKIKPCAFDGDCEITPKTRRFCSHCRLKKCFRSGMKAEMILDADGKKARQDKLIENRRKRQEAQAQQQQQEQQQQPTTPSLQEAVTSTTENLLARSGSGEEPCTTDTEEWYIPPLSSATQVNRSLRGSSALSRLLERAKKQATLLDFSVLTPQQSTAPVSELDIDVSFQHVSRDQLPSDPLKYWCLKDEERNLLRELTVAYQETVFKLPDRMDTVKPSNVQNILDRCQRFARDIVNFLKRLSDFKALQMQDQIAVLKGASWRTFLVKTSANFIVEMDAWIKDDGYVSVKDFTDVSPEHKDRILLLARYSAALKHIMRNDPTTFAVLQVMVLFDPRDPNLNNRQLVSELADKYALLLKHLLQSQWSFDYADYYLGAVRGKMQEMPWVAENIQVMFMDWLHLMEPLMREILNLS